MQRQNVLTGTALMGGQQMLDAEDILQLFLIQALRCCCQTKEITRCEILQCFGTVGSLGMLGFIKQNVVIVVLR